MKEKVLDMAEVQARFRTIAIIGTEKTGKTRFIGTAPRPCLVYCFDDGYATLAGQKGIEVRSLEDVESQDLDRLMTGLINEIPEYTWPDGRKEQFKTIAFDPVSFLSDSLMASEEKKSSDGFTVYRKLGKSQKEFLNKIRKLEDVNVIVTSHVEVKFDETTGTEMFLADINGKTRNSFGANFDAVLFTKVVPKGKTAEFYVCPIPDSRRKSGIRVPMGCENVFSNLEKPDFQYLKSKFEGVSGDGN